MPEQALRVLVVDDTAGYRKILSEVVESRGEAEIIGTNEKAAAFNWYQSKSNRQDHALTMGWQVFFRSRPV